MSTAGSVIRTLWSLMETGTAGIVPTVTSTMAFRRWVSKKFDSPSPNWHDCELQWRSSFFVCLYLYQNGDYNKPIPAQYMEHLNHGVSGGFLSSETPKTLQWVNCQMLLCRKCNNNQSAKIKQLASYIPRDDVCIMILFICINIPHILRIVDVEFVFFLFRRITMKKLKHTSTTLSRRLSYADHVRQQWNITLNTKTASFVQCSWTTSFGAPVTQTQVLLRSGWPKMLLFNEVQMQSQMTTVNMIFAPD